VVTKPTAVIVDVDGTLCDVSSVRHHVLNRPKDFDAFHSGSLGCPPHQQALHYVEQAADNGHTILIVTGRMEMWRDVTETWLDRNMRRQWYGPWMRSQDDFRTDVAVKREIHAELSKRWEIVGAIDDNPSIVALWQELGIPTVVMPGWEYENVR
jgi:hypothetical protein